jgi:hypothetical protein
MGGIEAANPRVEGQRRKVLKGNGALVHATIWKYLVFCSWMQLNVNI